MFPMDTTTGNDEDLWNKDMMSFMAVVQVIMKKNNMATCNHMTKAWHVTKI
jgi:hypothetical protein